MNTGKTSLAVAALRNGTVIDQIPSHSLFKAARILNIEHATAAVTIGNNLPSKKLGSKGIIKVADTVYPEATLNRIALIAPTAKINVIRDYEVVEKRHVELPDTIVGLVRCANPKCITNNEPMLTRFEVVDRDDVTIRCCYCAQEVKADNAIIID